MGDRMCQCGHYESDHGADGSCDSSASTGYCPCFIFDDSDAQPDPRDAEIAALKAEVERLTGLLDDADQVTRDALGHARAGWEGERERLTRALAAGPAALRKQAGRCKGSKRSECLIDAAEIVEAAQEAAMKEGK